VEIFFISVFCFFEISLAYLSYIFAC